MSLESQVSALVSAANKLTSEVAAKMKGIDKKVDDATQSIPKVMRRESRVEYYVDSVLGVDDDAQDGSENSPFKTIFYAIGRALPGAEVVIYLADGSEHICEVPENQTHHHSSNGKNIYIRTHTSSNDESAQATLIFRASVWPSGTASFSRCNFFEGSSFGVAFKNIRIKMTNETGKPLYSSSFGGLFSRGSGGESEVTRFNIMFRSCVIELNKKINFVTTYGGSVLMAADITRIQYDDSITSPILPLSTAKTLGMGSVTLENIGKGSDLTPEQILGFDITKSAESIYI